MSIEAGVHLPGTGILFGGEPWATGIIAPSLYRWCLPPLPIFVIALPAQAGQ